MAQRLSALTPRDVSIPSLVDAELLLGVLRSRDQAKTRRVVKRFLAPYAIPPFDHDAADHYADIRRELEKSGMTIGPNDLVIAATVRAAGCTLVTHNVREFSHIPGLRVEDWH